MDIRTIDVKTQKQQTPLWCWAAVGSACALFLDKNSQWTQCKFATDCIEPSPGVCCVFPYSSNKACVQTWYLVNSSQTKGSFVKAGINNGFITGAPDFATIQQSVKDALPVAFMLGFKKGKSFGGHFVHCRGYYVDDSGNNYILIGDSLNGDSRVLYTDFVSQYLNMFKVNFTFYTKNPNA